MRGLSMLLKIKFQKKKQKKLQKKKSFTAQKNRRN